MHPIHNAFDRISFGSNPNGIQHRATLDKTILCTSVIWECFFTLGRFSIQRDSLEDSVLSTMQGERCSIRTNYPRGRYSKGFSNMTLLTANEKVGINFTNAPGSLQQQCEIGG
jgi:hypothetical protein